MSINSVKLMKIQLKVQNACPPSLFTVLYSGPEGRECRSFLIISADITSICARKILASYQTTVTEGRGGGLKAPC